MAELETKYSFFPWLRRGLSAHIIEEDTLANTEGSQKKRPKITVKATIDVLKEKAAVTKKDESVEISIVGPGDVAGINPEAILQVVPAPGSQDFKYDFYPFIEFFEEDFPWRYTPAKAAASNFKLRPWLALLVCENSEFTLCNGADGVSFISLHIEDQKQYQSIFISPKNTWACAHTQFSNIPFTVGNAEVISNQVNEELSKNEDCGFSRLLSTRSLKEDTVYTAFLVPAYEVGRLRGLGDTQNTAAIPVQRAAWEENIVAQKNRLRPFDFPVYYHWSFCTKGAGFDELAKRIQAATTDDLPADIKIDVTKMGEGLDYAYLTKKAPKRKVIGVPVAAIPLEYTSEAYPKAADEVEIAKNIRKLLDMNPVLSESNGIYEGDDDPFIVPPLYGAKQIRATSLDEANNRNTPWFPELNLDVRRRIASGLGKKTVQTHQEDFVHRAWQQVEIINELNQQLRQSVLNSGLNNAIHHKSFNSNKLKDIMRNKHYMKSKRTKTATGIETSISEVLNAVGVPTAYASSTFVNLCDNKVFQDMGIHSTDMMQRLADETIYRFKEHAVADLVSKDQIKALIDKIPIDVSNYNENPHNKLAELIYFDFLTKYPFLDYNHHRHNLASGSGVTWIFTSSGELIDAGLDSLIKIVDGALYRNPYSINPTAISESLTFNLGAGCEAFFHFTWAKYWANLDKTNTNSIYTNYSRKWWKNGQLMPPVTTHKGVNLGMLQLCLRGYTNQNNPFNVFVISKKEYEALFDEKTLCSRIGGENGYYFVKEDIFKNKRYYTNSNNTEIVYNNYPEIFTKLDPTDLSSLMWSGLDSNRVLINQGKLSNLHVKDENGYEKQSTLGNIEGRYDYLKARTIFKISCIFNDYLKSEFKFSSYGDFMKMNDFKNKRTSNFLNSFVIDDGKKTHDRYKENCFFYAVEHDKNVEIFFDLDEGDYKDPRTNCNDENNSNHSHFHFFIYNKKLYGFTGKMLGGYINNTLSKDDTKNKLKELFNFFQLNVTALEASSSIKKYDNPFSYYVKDVENWKKFEADVNEYNANMAKLCKKINTLQSYLNSYTEEYPKTNEASVNQAQLRTISSFSGSNTLVSSAALTAIQNATGQTITRRRLADTARKYYKIATVGKENLLDRQVRTQYPLMAYPAYPDPVYYYLKEMSELFILPAAGELKQNTATLFSNNTAFVEAYLCGMNTEMGMELLWREYPTDARGSYFRKFWDTDSDTLSFTDENYHDVQELHKWKGKLGNNHQAGKSDLLIFAIKAELIKNYPGTEVYLHQGVVENTKIKLNMNPGAETIEPVLSAFLNEDIYLVGFAVTLEKIKGSVQGTTIDPGFFLTFKERVGETRFQTTNTTNIVTLSGNKTHAGEVAVELLNQPTLYGKHVCQFL